MAAMFRKSGKRNFRKKNLEISEEEEDANENQSTENIDSSTTGKLTEKGKSKEKIEKIASTSSLLSFDDHEDEEEVFQVRKSKESRRLSKKSKTKKEKIKSESREEENDDNDGDSRRGSPENDDNADSKLAALRAELHQMSKLDEEEEEDDDGKESDDFQENDDKKSQLGAPIRQHQFNIPDAATIHALKKKREMARQFGTGQDFIPLDDTKRFTGRFDSASRLVREDENDASDEDDGPISFNVVKTQDNFYMKDEGVENEEGEDEEEDEETKRWENEQIRKGVSASQTQQDKEQQSYGVQNISASKDNYQQNSLFNQNIYPYGGGYGQESSQQKYNGTSHLPGQTRSSKPQVVTMETVWDAMNKRLESLNEVHRGHCMEQDKLAEHQRVSEESIEKLIQRGVEAERQYGFYQEMRGYVRDLIECLNEKVPALEASEKSMGDLLKQRAQRFVERRQEDVKDQADEFLSLQSGKPKQNAKPIIDEFGRDMTMYVEERKKRRAAEREGRKMRRRRNREIAGTNTAHHEGMSTDDEETETDSRQLKSESERIIQESKTIFEDVIEDFSSIEKVKSKFEKWKNVCEDSYKNAYISLCLPKLFTIFVRLELLGWNPLREDAMDIEQMSWYNSLVGFGFHEHEDIDPKDDDVKIIPSVIEKAVLTKLIGIVQHVWDPMSSKQTERLIGLLKTLSDDFPTVQASNKITQQLFSAVVTRMKKAVNDDVYVPLYPKQLLDNKSSGALEFFQRQYWSCHKLFCNILLWDGLLSSRAIQQLALDGLLNRYLILGLQHSTLYYDSLEKCKMITNTIPRSWLILLTDTTLPTLETFARFLVNLASCLQRSCAGCSDLEKKKARSGCKKIVQHLTSLKAKDRAKAVAVECGLGDALAL